MTRRSISRRSFEASLACLLLAVPCSAAFAADPKAEEEPRQIRTSREILMQEDAELRKKNSWLSPNFHFNEKAGFGYAKELKWGDRSLVFRVRGPIMRKQKALGLRFRLKF